MYVGMNKKENNKIDNFLGESNHKELHLLLSFDKISLLCQRVNIYTNL